ncbi:MAG: glycerophosphodiester phosphodiesterase [Bacteriovorax sp.]|nr:glycerophosphodiester phosphodiesterase [Bacteriovorax sp.]
MLLISFLNFGAVAFEAPLIIGHRGACGYRPEHTIASYELAISMGADYIEPDLVMTKDKVLMCRHENEISGTTDVAEKFPARKTTKKVDGKEITGWFIEDFTLKEMKTLRAKERLAFRDHSYDGKFEVPTFSEVLDLVKKQKRKVGVYPETKHPTYFQSIGLPLEEALVKELTDHSLNKKGAAVFIQSFEMTNLKKLKTLTKLPLIYLIDDPEVIPFDHVVSGDKRSYKDMLTPASLKEISATVYGIGPYKRYILPENEKREALPATNLIKDAHAVGLKVHPYTFRSEAQYLLKDYQGDPQKEYLQFFELGVDALFSDFADQAVLAKQTFLKNKKTGAKK